MMRASLQVQPKAIGLSASSAKGTPSRTRVTMPRGSTPASRTSASIGGSSPSFLVSS
jgi:hypothetical protein